MKRAALLLFCLFPLMARAATPTFDSFRQDPGFLVSQPYIYLVRTNTGGTNVFNGVTNIFINSTIYNTGSTIINSNTTSFFASGTITITNTTVNIDNSSLTINGTNVPVVNPTIGRYPYKDGPSSFGDGAFYFIDTNTAGIDTLADNTLIVTNISGGGVLYGRTFGGTSGYVTNLPNALGVLTNDGTGVLGWGTVSQPWIFSGGYLQPADLTQPLFWTNSLTWGPGNTTSLQRSGTDLQWTNNSADVKISSINQSGNGVALEAQSSSAVGISSSGSPASLFLRNGSDQVAMISANFQPGTDLSIGLGDETGVRWSKVATGGAIYDVGFLDNAHPTNYSRLAINMPSGTNGPIQFDSQANGSAGNARPFNFDLGGTNMLSLSTTLMDFNPNGLFTAKIQTHNSGNTAITTSRGALNSVELYTTGLGTGISLQSYGELLENFQAATSSTPQNSPGLTWVGQGWSTNSAASQSVVFTAYAAPVSGNLTPQGQLEFQGYYNSSGGLTPMAAFDLDTTSGDTRLLLWDVAAGTLVRVTRGAADSGGTGFRVLRIPN